MKIQTRILLICGNVLLIIGTLMDKSIHPSGTSYIKGMSTGVLAGVLLLAYFDWREKREQKILEPEENNLTNL